MKKNDVINAGELNNKIDILKREIVKDNFGQEVETFSLFLSVWAKVDRHSVTGIDYKVETNEKLKVRNKYSIEIRYLSVIKEDMRLSFKNKTLKILNIENVFESNVKLIIVCEEVI